MTSKPGTGEQTKAPSDHAARRPIARHETLCLSERDRAAFFEAISLHPRRASAWHAPLQNTAAASAPEP